MGKKKHQSIQSLPPNNFDFGAFDGDESTIGIEAEQRHPKQTNKSKTKKHQPPLHPKTHEKCRGFRPSKYGSWWRKRGFRKNHQPLRTPPPSQHYRVLKGPGVLKGKGCSWETLRISFGKIGVHQTGKMREPPPLAHPPLNNPITTAAPQPPWTLRVSPWNWWWNRQPSSWAPP